MTVLIADAFALSLVLLWFRLWRMPLLAGCCGIMGMVDPADCSLSLPSSARVRVASLVLISAKVFLVLSSAKVSSSHM